MRRYLRWEGTVPNNRLSQTQVNSLITGFWKHALTSDLNSLVVRYWTCLCVLPYPLTVCPVSCVLPYQVEDSVWEYLLSVNAGNEAKAVEDAYNLQVSRPNRK